ncbi:MAG: type II toxin-antitoxin system RelE/ParE family toxin [Candidatus Woesearchaeota archaeon]
MVTIAYEDFFKKTFKKLIKSPLKEKVKKQIKKIIDDPLSGKPMKYARKGTRELYVKSFRISYTYYDDRDELVFADIYHKNEQ